MDSTFTLAALIGGTALVFQFVLMLFGFGDDGADVAGAEGADLSSGAEFGDMEITADHPTWNEAADADLGHPGAPWFYEMLSLRSLSAAATFFGLAGKTLLAFGYSNTQAFVFSSLTGLAAMYAVYWLFKQVYRLQHAGNENVRRAIGHPATVYVPIPAKRGGAGKVTFRLQDRLVEYQAVTGDDQRLKTGEKVVVIDVVNSDTVCVARATASPADATSNMQDIASST
jgi:hypothetical protein